MFQQNDWTRGSAVIAVKLVSVLKLFHALNGAVPNLYCNTI